MSDSAPSSSSGSTSSPSSSKPSFVVHRVDGFPIFVSTKHGSNAISDQDKDQMLAVVSGNLNVEEEPIRCSPICSDSENDPVPPKTAVFNPFPAPLPKRRRRKRDATPPEEEPVVRRRVKKPNRGYDDETNEEPQPKPKKKSPAKKPSTKVVVGPGRSSMDRLSKLTGAAKSDTVCQQPTPVTAGPSNSYLDEIELFFEAEAATKEVKHTKPASRTGSRRPEPRAGPSRTARR